MTRQEKLDAIKDAMEAMKRICPPLAGKSQHHCAICEGHPERHPCPGGAAMAAIYSSWGLVFGDAP